VPFGSFNPFFMTFEGRMQGAANWGYAQALAAAQRLAAEERQKGAAGWPEPITDRPPTEADGDVTQDGYASGMVQVLFHGLWDMCHWSVVGGRPWHHTPRWRPPAPSNREQAITALREQALRDLYAIKDIMARQGLGITEERSLMFHRLRQALEEAGDV
jgi:hypothetical protein